MTMPRAWIAALIDTRRRAANATTCPRCGTPTLTGDDNDTAALTVTVDATPTTPAGELRATLRGLTTYDLIGGELCHRDTPHLRLHRHPIHIQHTCGRHGMIPCVNARHHDTSPVPATHGARICKECADATRHNIAAMPKLYRDLAHVDTVAPDGPRVSGSRERQLPINIETHDHRALMHDLLATWAAWAAAGNGDTPPRRDVATSTATLLRHHTWAIAQDEDNVTGYVDTITALHNTARRLATPTRGRPPRATPIAPCPSCPADDNAQLWHVAPTLIACDHDPAHVWPQHSWPTLRRDIARQATP